MCDCNNGIGVFGLEKHLKQWGEVDYRCNLLHSCWVLEKPQLAMQLKTIVEAYPFFSEHDESHSQSVVIRMEQLLGDERIRLLSPTDTWLLLECAYSHDVGMRVKESDVRNAIENGYIDRCFDNPDKKPPEDVMKAYNLLRDNKGSLKSKLEEGRASKYSLGDDWLHLMPELRRAFQIVLSYYFRPKHAEMSAKYLRETECPKDLIPRRLRQLIADICSCHGLDAKSIMDKLPHITSGINKDIAHPRLVAMLLRLADALDIENNRFNPYQLEIYDDETDLSSKAYQLKHKAISHIYVDPSRVEVVAKFDTGMIPHNSGQMEDDERDMLIYNACKIAGIWFQYLEEDLKFWAVHWQDIVPERFSGSAPRMTRSEVWLDSEKMDMDKFNHEYRISHRRAAEIIEGTDLYKDDDLVFLRELIQNAMDAEKIKFFSQMKNQEYDYLFQKITAKEFKNEGRGDEFKNFSMPQVFDVIDIQVFESMPIIITVTLIRKPNRLDGSSDLELKIEVLDHGTGISLKDIQHMRMVGRARSGEERAAIEQMPEWLKPTGAFGIGMQSVFGFIKGHKNSFEAITRSHDDNILRTLYFKSTADEGSLLALKCGDQGNSFPSHGTKVIIRRNAKNVLKKAVMSAADPFSPHYTLFRERIKQYIENNFYADVFPVYVYFREIDKNGTVVSNERKLNFPPFYSRFQSRMNEMTDYGNGLKLIVQPGGENNRFFEIHALAAEENIYLHMSFNPGYNSAMPIGGSRLYYRGILVCENKEYDLRFPFFDTEICLWVGDATRLLKINRLGLLSDDGGDKATEKRRIIHTVQRTVLAVMESIFMAWESYDPEIAIAGAMAECSKQQTDAPWKKSAEDALAAQTNLPLAFWYYWTALYMAQSNTCACAIDPSAFYPAFRKIIENQLIKYPMSIMNFTGNRYLREMSLLESNLFMFDKQWFIPDKMAMYTASEIMINYSGEPLPLQLIPDFISPVLKDIYMQDMRIVRMDDNDVPLYRLGPYRQPFIKMPVPEQKRWIELSLLVALRSGESRQRAVVPGLEPFKNLSVKAVPEGSVADELLRCGCYLIFSLNDEEIKQLYKHRDNPIEQKAILAGIRATEAYENLVAYVEDKQVIKNRLTKKMITDEYCILENFTLSILNALSAPVA